MAFSNLTFLGFLFLAVISVVSCTYCDLKFTDCGSKGKVYSVQINETCDKNHNAVLEKGTNVSINFTFSADAPEQTLTSEVHGQIAGVPFWIPFPLGNANACEKSGLDCPTAANKKYNYLPILEVKSSYPPVKAKVKWELKDKDENDIFCIELIADITEKHV